MAAVAPPPARPLWRLGAVVVCLALAALCVGQYLGYRNSRAEAIQLALEAQVHHRDPQILEGLLRERDPVYAQLRVARAVISDELDPNRNPLATPKDQSLPAVRERLQLAGRLATEAQARVPTAWEAPMLLGAATYLDWSLSRDERLVREYQVWEAPLLRGLELAPAHREPAFLLATAYLELWPILSSEKRRQTTELVGRAMADRLGFERLIGPWLERAESLDLAFAAIPPRTDAWQRVMREYADRRRWPIYLRARQRWSEALEEEVRAAEEEARRRLAAADARGAREVLLRAAVLVPADSALTSRLDELFQQCPPGTTHSRYVPGLEAHLDRVLEFFLLGLPTLEPSTVARLSFALEAADRLPTPRRALAALAAGDLARAESLARRSQSNFLSIEWAPYLLARARELTRRGELGAAAQDLDRVHPAWSLRPLYWHVEGLLAKAQGDGAAAQQARRRLLLASGGPRGMQQWRSRGRGFQLEWFAETPVQALRFSFQSVPPGGAAVEVWVDGRSLGARTVRSGRRLHLEVALEPEALHVLEVRSVAGGDVNPGPVRVVPAETAADPVGPAGKSAAQAPPGPPHTKSPG